MFEQKYGIKPNRFMVWLGLYLGSAVFAYIKLFHDAPLAFLLILLIDNVLTLSMGLDRLMEEAMEEVKQGLELYIFVIGTTIGSIMLVVLFFIDFQLAMILAIAEIIAVALNKIKSNKYML